MQFNYKKINYTSPGSAQGGPGIGPAIPWFTSPYIDMTATQLRQLGLRLGDTFWLGGEQAASGGNCFKVVKADAALTVGQLVAPAPPAASTIGAAAPAPSTASVNWVAGGLTVNAEVDNYIMVTTAAAAAVGNLRRIKANTATTITVALSDYLRPNLPTDNDVFPFIPVAGDVANIIRPHHVIVNTATTIPCGVALGTVTQFNYTLIQVAGLAIVSAVNTTALVAMQPAVGAAAGQATGSAAAAANLYAQGCVIIPLVANAAGSRMDAFYVNFTGA
jgi:hypothetical protein